MIFVLLLQSSLHVAGGTTSWVTGVSGTNGGEGGSNGEGGAGVPVGGSSSWECISLDGQRIKHGDNFVPGPDYCTVCKCEEGIARFCRAVLCQPPQDCKSFRVGKTCCDFICLDDILPKVPDDNSGTTTTDLGLRMVASAITAILSLALLLFLIHRLRQRRLRAHQQYYEDQLDSPAGGAGASGDVCHNNGCCHNAAYCSANDHVDLFFEGHTPPYSLWKPPSFYFNYEDNPPPYSEVVGSSSYQSSSLPLTVQLPRESSADHTPIGIASQASAVAGMAQAASRLGTLERRETVLRSDQVYEDNDLRSDILPNEPAPPYSTLLPSNHSRGPPQSPSRRSTLNSPAQRSPTAQNVHSAAISENSPIHYTLDTYTDYAQGSPTYNGHIIRSDDIQTTQTSPVYSQHDNIPLHNLTHNGHVIRSDDIQTTQTSLIYNKQDNIPLHSLNDLNRATAAAADISAATENNTHSSDEMGAVGGISSSSKRQCLSNKCNVNGATYKKISDSDTVGSSASENINDDPLDSHSQITTVRQRVKSITEKQQQQQQQQMSTLEDFRVRLTQDLSDSSLSSTTQPTTRTLSTSSSDDTSIDTYCH